MQQVLARKCVQKTKLDTAEMICDPWNQEGGFYQISACWSQNLTDLML